MTDGMSDAARSERELRAETLEVKLRSDDLGRTAIGNNKEKYTVVDMTAVLAGGIARRVFLLQRQDERTPSNQFELFDENGRWFDSIEIDKSLWKGVFVAGAEPMQQLRALFLSGDRNATYNLFGVARRPEREAAANPLYW